MYRKAERGTGSTLARVLAFDDPPAASVTGGYIVSASISDVTKWYISELEGRGWTTGMLRPSRDLDPAYQVFSRTNHREYFHLRIPNDLAQQVSLQRLGTRPLLPGEVFFSVAYKIFVKYEDERDTGSPS